MRSTALICELNPLHNGHRHIIDRAKNECDCLIAIMSGNFTQRSECAIFDKYTRAADALAAGADLVFELPFPWSSSSASFFAGAGVSLADHVGADRLVFASECGDIGQLRRAAAVSAEFDAINECEKSRTAAGFASEREKYASARGCDPELFSRPNNILAIEYIKAAASRESALDIATFARVTGKEYTEAGKIRALLRDGDADGVLGVVPELLAREYANRMSRGEYAVREKLFDAVRLMLLMVSHSDPSLIFDAGGGVGCRLSAAARRSASGTEMFEMVKTKKYTDSRMRRAALYMTLGVSESVMREMPRYTVLLGANRTGCEYLSEIRRTRSVNIVTKPADGAVGAASEQYALAVRADMLWCSCRAAPLAADYFLRQHPIIIT